MIPGLGTQEDLLPVEEIGHDPIQKVSRRGTPPPAEGARGFGLMTASRLPPLLRTPTMSAPAAAPNAPPLAPNREAPPITQAAIALSS